MRTQSNPISTDRSFVRLSQVRWHVASTHPQLAAFISGDKGVGSALDQVLPLRRLLAPPQIFVRLLEKMRPLLNMHEYTNEDNEKLVNAQLIWYSNLILSTSHCRGDKILLDYGVLNPCWLIFMVWNANEIKITKKLPNMEICYLIYVCNAVCFIFNKFCQCVNVVG